MKPAIGPKNNNKTNGTALRTENVTKSFHKQELSVLEGHFYLIKAITSKSESFKAKTFYLTTKSTTSVRPIMVSHRGHNCIFSALTILDSALS